MRGTGRASPLLGGEVFGRRAQVAWFGFYDQRSKGCGPLEASWPLGLVPLLSEKIHFRVKQLEWGLAEAIGEHLGWVPAIRMMFTSALGLKLQLPMGGCQCCSRDEILHHVVSPSAPSTPPLPHPQNLNQTTCTLQPKTSLRRNRLAQPVPRIRFCFGGVFARFLAPAMPSGIVAP